MKIRTPHEVQRKPRLGSLTQLVECLLCKQDVRSSILLGSTIEDVLEHLTSVDAGSGVSAAKGSASRIVALSSSLISMPLVSAWFASRLPWSFVRE